MLLACLRLDPEPITFWGSTFADEAEADEGPPVLTVADMHKTHICSTPILENNREGACALIPSLSRSGGLPLQMKPRRTKGEHFGKIVLAL